MVTWWWCNSRCISLSQQSGFLWKTVAEFSLFHSQPFSLVKQGEKMLYFPRKSRTTWHELRLQYIREKWLLSPLHSEASSSLPVGLLMDCSTRNIYKCIVFIEGGVKNDCLLVMITKTSYFGCVFFVFLSLVRPAGRWCGSCWEEEKLLFTLE